MCLAKTRATSTRGIRPVQSSSRCPMSLFVLIVPCAIKRTLSRRETEAIAPVEALQQSLFRGGKIASVEALQQGLFRGGKIAPVEALQQSLLRGGKIAPVEALQQSLLRGGKIAPVEALQQSLLERVYTRDYGFNEDTTCFFAIYQQSHDAIPN